MQHSRRFFDDSTREYPKNSRIAQAKLLSSAVSYGRKICIAIQQPVSLQTDTLVSLKPQFNYTQYEYMYLRQCCMCSDVKLL